MAESNNAIGQNLTVTSYGKCVW